MKTIITVTESRSLRGQFEITAKKGENRPGYYEAYGAGEAAARAMECAMCCGGDYIIFAGDKVLAHIPADMRSNLK